LSEGTSARSATLAVEGALAQIGVRQPFAAAFRERRGVPGFLNSQPCSILAALITVYIVLGVLYEATCIRSRFCRRCRLRRRRAPCPVAVSKEFSVRLDRVSSPHRHREKNAIMMIDFALDAERNRDKNSREAIFEACLLRFRRS